MVPATPNKELKKEIERKISDINPEVRVMETPGDKLINNNAKYIDLQRVMCCHK